MPEFTCNRCGTKISDSNSLEIDVVCPQCQANTAITANPALVRQLGDEKEFDVSIKKSANWPRMTAYGLIGFTILVVLSALLIPATRRVRESAARTQTINNLKLVALAAHGFNDQFKRLPKAWDAILGTGTPGTYSTPLGQMAPYYENNINSIINPQDYSFTGKQVSAGSPKQGAACNNPYTSIAANNFLFGDPAKGLYTQPANATTTAGTPLSVSTIRDGASNTMMFVTCFAVCNDTNVTLNTYIAGVGVPFLTGDSKDIFPQGLAKVGEVNPAFWQSAPQVSNCWQSLGSRAQSYNGAAIAIALGDGTARNVLGMGSNATQYYQAILPADGGIPFWD